LLTKYYGLLSGACFSISFSIAGIFWGIASEKYSRKNIATLACIGWSLTSLVTGNTTSFAVLAGMRFLMGIFMSAYDPAMFALVADYFPKKKFSTAISLITSAPYLGGGFSSA
jgi:MFS family permease